MKSVMTPFKLPSDPNTFNSTAPSLDPSSEGRIAKNATYSASMGNTHSVLNKDRLRTAVKVVKMAKVLEKKRFRKRTGAEKNKQV